MTSHIPRLRGHVKIWNEAGDTLEHHNLVVYGAGDIITALLSGNDDYRISHMYFAYENTVGTPTPLTPARTDTAALFHGFSSPRDFVRAVALTPTITAVDGNHTGNRATFMAIANVSTGVLGRPFGAANNSKVFSLGLVAAPTGAYAGDVLYAHFSLPTALPAVGAGQISASWAIEAD